MWSYAKLNISECTHVGSFLYLHHHCTWFPTGLSQDSISGQLIHFLVIWDNFCSVQWPPLTRLLSLGLQQTMPAANLLSFRLFHLSPVGELLLSRAVEAEWNPTNHLFTLHTSLVVHGEDECDVWKLKKGYLEDKRLFVGRVGLTSADGCLALWHLVAHGVQ